KVEIERCHSSRQKRDPPRQPKIPTTPCRVAPPTCRGGLTRLTVRRACAVLRGRVGQRFAVSGISANSLVVSKQAKLPDSRRSKSKKSSPHSDAFRRLRNRLRNER